VPAQTEVDGASLLRWCAYYGDVSGVRLVLSRGAALSDLGANLDLNGAAFHGHWRLCQFLLEHGASANHALADTGETALHATFCCRDSDAHTEVARVLLAHGARVDATTRVGAATGCFMRDARTRGETALHRAAAFGTQAAVQLLLSAGAAREARDAHGDTPLSWASWHARPVAILRLLCYGEHRIHPDYASMSNRLIGASQR
jgi:ankyrin repeat protein